MPTYFLQGEKLLRRLNLYAAGNDLDDAALMGLCRTPAERGLGSLTVDDGQLEAVWKWLEKSGVLLAGRIDVSGRRPKPDELFRRVKSAYAAGGAMVEVAPPPDFYGDGAEAGECLAAIAEAKGSRPAKVCVESGFISSISDIRRVASLVAGSGVDYVKTASGLWARSSSIGHLNAILEELRDADAGVDFLFDPALSNQFVADDALRLASRLRGPDFLAKFYISCNPKLFHW